MERATWVFLSRFPAVGTSRGSSDLVQPGFTIFEMGVAVSSEVVCFLLQEDSLSTYCVLGPVLGAGSRG